MQTTMDYDSMVAQGTALGSGGVIIMDETTCMVSIKNIIYFTKLNPVASVPLVVRVQNGPMICWLKFAMVGLSDIDKLRSIAMALKDERFVYL